MPVVTKLSDDLARDIANAALSEQLGRYGFDHAEVHSGYDHDGDEAIFVTAFVAADVSPPDGDTLSKAHEALEEGLQAKGEQRFPYFKLRQIGELPVDDGVPTGPA